MAKFRQMWWVVAAIVIVIAVVVYSDGRHVLVATALIMVAAGVLLGSILTFPALIVKRDSDPSGAKLTQAEFLKAKNDVRTTLLQGIAGGLLLLGAIFTWLQLQATQEGLQITEQGQITTRYTQAVGQLGNKQEDVRVGGIYALERIARESERDRDAIFELTLTYVRKHSYSRGLPVIVKGRKSAETKSRCPARPSFYDEVAPLSTMDARAPDVQAALDILSKDYWASKLEGRSLTEVDLRLAVLSNLHLRGVWLSGSNLSGANFENGSLDLAEFQTLGSAFCPARLVSARFRNASLKRVNFQDAYLDEADFSYADLSEANFSEAHVSGADFTGANLAKAKFTNARADRRTVWPEGFEPKSHGILVES